MKHPIHVLFSTVILGVVGFVSAEVDPTVSLDYGSLKGKYNAGYDITLFRRIPFAAPPTGPNRFGPPKPPANISGVYDTDKDFPGCPQRETQGSEDCLYLGLYSRPWTNATAKRPVVVFFHGGGVRFSSIKKPLHVLYG